MEHDSEPTLRDLFRLLRRGFVLAVSAALVAGAATYLVNRAAAPTFEAQATIVSSSQDPNQRDFGTTLVTAPPLDANAYRVAITSRPVLAGVLEELDGRAATAADVDRLERSLTVRADGTSTTSLFRLVVVDESPTRARDLANAIANAAIQWDAQRATRSLESIIDSLESQIASIDAELATETPAAGLDRARGDLALQLSSARALRSGAIGRLELLEAADVPRFPVSPRPTRNAALAGMLAAALVYGVLLVLNLLDTRVRNLEELVRVTGLPLLAEFPKVAGGRRMLPKEAASYLRTAVSFATASDAEPKVLLVTSTGAAHGKSSVAMALAESFSRQHYRVLLIDADLRRAVLATEYGISASRAAPVREALVDPAAVRPVTIAVGRELTLDLLPSFNPVHNPTELLANHMRGLHPVPRAQLRRDRDRLRARPAGGGRAHGRAAHHGRRVRGEHAGRRPKASGGGDRPASSRRCPHPRDGGDEHAERAPRSRRLWIRLRVRKRRRGLGSRGPAAAQAATGTKLTRAQPHRNRIHPTSPSPSRTGGSGSPGGDSGRPAAA